MSLDVLRAKVSDVISNSACSAEFYFLLSVDGQLIIKRADIEQAASDELAQNFISTISNEILLNDELSLLDISGADDRANAIYRYDLLDVPVQIQHLTDVLAHDRFETFSFEADDLSHLKGDSYNSWSWAVSACSLQTSISRITAKEGQLVQPRSRSKCAQANKA